MGLCAFSSADREQFPGRFDSISLQTAACLFLCLCLCLLPLSLSIVNTLYSWSIVKFTLRYCNALQEFQILTDSYLISYSASIRSRCVRAGPEAQQHRRQRGLRAQGMPMPYASEALLQFSSSWLCLLSCCCARKLDSEVCVMPCAASAHTKAHYTVSTFQYESSMCASLNIRRIESTKQ